MKDIELYRDSFQNFRSYQLPKAQLIIADIPYNLGTNAYASNPSWYKNGDNKNGESDLAGKKFFNSENEFRPAEFMHFCSDMLVKEPPVNASKKLNASIPMHDNILRIRTTVHAYRTWPKVWVNEIHPIGIP